DCWPFIPRQPRRLQRREAGLPVFRGKQSSKLIVCEVDDLLQRSEIGDNFKHGVGVLCKNCALGFEVCVNVGATKTIDRLLRITDDKQTASPQLALCPRRSLVALAVQLRARSQVPAIRAGARSLPLREPDATRGANVLQASRARALPMEKMMNQTSTAVT